MSLTNDEVLQILKLIDESDYDEVRLEIGDFKIHVSKRGASGGDQAVEVAASASPPVTAAVAEKPAAVPKGASPEHVQEGLIAIRAPMLGTFFRAPAPGEKPFVEVGGEVEAADTVCLLEVMKLFNSVKAGICGTVAGVHVENGAMVEYDQVLITIKPR